MGNSKPEIPRIYMEFEHNPVETKGGREFKNWGRGWDLRPSVFANWPYSKEK